MCNVRVGGAFRHAELHSVVADGKQRLWLHRRVDARGCQAVIRWDGTQRGRAGRGGRRRCRLGSGSGRGLRSRSRCFRRGIEGRCEENGQGECDGASNYDTVHQQFSIHGYFGDLNRLIAVNYVDPRAACKLFPLATLYDLQCSI